MTRALAFLLLCLWSFGLAAAGPAHADVIIVVTTTADTAAADGACSLREAITAANGNGNYFECVGRGGGYDLIEFALGPGTPVIQLSTSLPDITGPLEIDGGPNRVELRGGGLRINGAGAAWSVVRHLVLPYLGIQYTSNVLVAGNYIGTDASGTAGSEAGSRGIQVVASSVQIGGTNGLTPGGPCTGDCNLISGRTTAGLELVSGSSALVRGNYIGTDRTGTLPLGNGNGILVEDSISTIGGPGSGNLISGNGIGITFDIRFGPCDSTIQGNLIGADATGSTALANGAGMQVGLFNRNCVVTIGGSAAGEGNVISGNTGNGVYLITADDVVVHGNRIGTRADGVTPLPNGGVGVFLSSSTHGNQIGGVGAGQGNVIAWNATGVQVGINNYYNTVRGNSIHDNTGKGIQLDDAQYNSAVTPILFGGNPVFGTSSCPYCTVDIYSDAAGEGGVFEGSVQADDQGSFVFAGAASGPYITATTTGPQGSTSEFSIPVPYDRDGDGVFDASDNCPTVANLNQADGDLDAVGDLCDSCTTRSNPRVGDVAAFLAANTWATLTGGQRDDDHDGYGNKCDADFTPTGLLVGSADLTEFRASNGKNRTGDTCGTAGTRPCAIFDLDESGLLIGTADLTQFRALNGKAAGPKCAACTGTNSVPLPCQAGSTGTCN